MGKEGRRAVRSPQATQEPVCPACGQPVGTTIKRHKVLGAWVPTWHPRPCRNPDCALFGRTPKEPGDWEHARRARKHRRRDAGKAPDGREGPEGPEGPGGRAAEGEPGNSTKIG
ncbi:hypothetical protein I3F58_01570 [Streptomyces sp. MUM 203J]|uniref:hypothetical protein n=1 Tax=Streptomyces sp. MUM 203J TaxID=2791990 RepID=UPI001F03C1A1|nr:hypothetical protein [Streptomyces sp. MUM 203J]MCH0538269.1 hypothetical protein [Streptomyces sp. MUM 203J]